jgi:hypothetical protein
MTKISLLAFVFEIFQYIHNNQFLINLSSIIQTLNVDNKKFTHLKDIIIKF